MKLVLATMGMYGLDNRIINMREPQRIAKVKVIIVWRKVWYNIFYFRGSVGVYNFSGMKQYCFQLEQLSL